MLNIYSNLIKVCLFEAWNNTKSFQNLQYYDLILLFIMYNYVHMKPLRGQFINQNEQISDAV